MPDITPYYSPPASGAFSPSSWNRTLYNPTADDSLEVKNGRIDADNLHADFMARPQHIRAGQAVDVSSVGSGEPLDFHDDSGVYDEKFSITIPGSAQTFYQKWDASVALVTFQVFAHAWRWAVSGGSTGFDLWTSLFVDGVEASHTRRKMPTTVNIIDLDPGAGTHTGQIILEQYNTRLRSQHHTITDLSKGWHSIQVKAWVQRGDFTERVEMDQYIAGGIIGNHMPTQWYELHNRLTTGVRNMTVLRAL